MPEVMKIQEPIEKVGETASLPDVDPSGADLKGADLSNTNLSGAKLIEAHLRSAYLDDDTRLDGIIGLEL